MALRVVAGSARGRRLEAPPGDRVRPTSDRVREAVFNALDSQGLVVGATVLDLFAGYGALAIEALSPGASRAVLVDVAAPALASMRRNLATAGFEDRAVVVRSDALDHLRRSARAASDDDGDDRAGARVDLVLADPPYAFDDWSELWPLLAAVAPGGTVVAESDRPVAAPAGATVLREKRYGGTVVTIISLAGPGPHDPQEPEDLT